MTNPTDRDKPELCPFCGGEAASFFHRIGERGDSWHVECQADDCGCGTCHHDTEADAIAAWNRRPTPQAGDELAREPVAWRWRVMDEEGEWSDWFLQAAEPSFVGIEKEPLTALTASGNDVLREAWDAIEPQLDADNPEPPLREIIYGYYTYYYDMDRASELTRAYIEAMRAALSTTPTMSAEDMREAAAKVGQALGKSHSYSGATSPVQVTLGFHTLEDRDAFIDAHIAAIQARAALTKEPSQ